MNESSSHSLLIFYGFDPGDFAQAVDALKGMQFTLVDASQQAPTHDMLLTCRIAFFRAEDALNSLGQFARRTYTESPKAQVVLCSTRLRGSGLDTVFSHGVFHVLNIAGAEWANRLGSYCSAMLAHPAEWNSRGLLDVSGEFHNLPFDFQVDRQVQLDAALSFFSAAGLSEETSADIRLVLDEMLNNALYHGLGHDTPAAEEMDTLGRIVIEFGLDSVHALVSVRDSGGSLDAQRISEVLVRQIKQEGLFDVRGRGLHLMRHVSDEIYFHLQPGRGSQVTLLLGRTKNPLVKSLQINCPPSKN